MARLGALRRIAAMYGALEQMRLVELQRAAGALSEAEGMLAGEQELSREAVADGREALAAGSRAEWLLTETQQEYLAMRRPRLEGLRDERAVVRDAAQVEFLESRARTEQMKQVVKDLKTAAEVEESRLLQAGMDERFLMRLHWREMRERRGG